MQFSKTQALWVFLFCVGLIRLFSLALYPLMDTTEARYGEMARIMLETGNWITPQFDYGIPFWGKPPMFSWVSSLSIGVFGNSEFFLRLPHFLSAIAVLWLLWKFVIYLTGNRAKALQGITVTATTIGFLVAAGIIMTDMLLTLSMTLAMVSFWRGWHGERMHIYLMYLAIGLGLLTKGPLVIVLVCLVLIPWLLIEHGWHKMWSEIWKRMAIPYGLLIIAVVSVPWYLLAERSTPGFLEYFLMGEHFYRFVDSGWQGDLYGSAHAEPRGMIWLYWIIVALPWSPLLLWGVYKLYVQDSTVAYKDRSLNHFLLLWLVSPMLLFTLAGNILPAYTLPGLPAMGLLLGLNKNLIDIKYPRILLLVSPLVLVIAVFTITLFTSKDRSDKYLFEKGISQSAPIYYYRHSTFSSRYYTSGQAKRVENLPADSRYYLAVKKEDISKISLDHCQLKSNNKRRALYYCTIGDT